MRPERDRGSRVREAEIGERWPELEEWADVGGLDSDIRRDLRGLSRDNAEFVGRHLVAAGLLADDDPELAWRHARAARSGGGRIAVVRETVGLVAYRAGEWSEAISELRAARRMGGGAGQVAVLADCERALGHPERAIELGRSSEANALDPDAAVELRIVVAGARADLGQLDAAIVHLRGAGLPPTPDGTTPARLAFAYADLLERAGRSAEALEWFMAAAEADIDDETDAAQRATAVAETLTGQPDPVRAESAAPTDTDTDTATETATETADASRPVAATREPDPPDPAGQEPDQIESDDAAHHPESLDPARQPAERIRPDPADSPPDEEAAEPDPWDHPDFSDSPEEPDPGSPEAGTGPGSLFSHPDSHPDEPVR